MNKINHLEAEMNRKEIESIMKIESLRLLRTLYGNDSLEMNDSLVTEFLWENMEDHDINYVFCKQERIGNSIKLWVKDDMDIYFGWWIHGDYLKWGNFTISLPIDDKNLITYQEAVETIDKTFPKIWFNQEIDEQRFTIAIKKTNKNLYIDKVLEIDWTKKRYHLQKKYHDKVSDITLWDCFSIIEDKDNEKQKQELN